MTRGWEQFVKPQGFTPTIVHRVINPPGPLKEPFALLLMAAGLPALSLHPYAGRENRKNTWSMIRIPAPAPVGQDIVAKEKANRRWFPSSSSSLVRHSVMFNTNPPGMQWIMPFSFYRCWSLKNFAQQDCPTYAGIINLCVDTPAKKCFPRQNTGKFLVSSLLELPGGSCLLQTGFSRPAGRACTCLFFFRNLHKVDIFL